MWPRRGDSVTWYLQTFWCMRFKVMCVLSLLWWLCRIGFFSLNVFSHRFLFLFYLYFILNPTTKWWCRLSKSISHRKLSKCHPILIHRNVVRMFCNFLSRQWQKFVNVVTILFRSYTLQIYPPHQRPFYLPTGPSRAYFIHGYFACSESL